MTLSIWAAPKLAKSFIFNWIQMWLVWCVTLNWFIWTSLEKLGKKSANTHIFCPIVEFSWKRRSTSMSKLQVVMHQVIPPTTCRGELWAEVFSVKCTITINTSVHGRGGLANPTERKTLKQTKETCSFSASNSTSLPVSVLMCWYCLNGDTHHSGEYCSAYLHLNAEHK